MPCFMKFDTFLESAHLRCTDSVVRLLSAFYWTVQLNRFTETESAVLVAWVQDLPVLSWCRHLAGTHLLSKSVLEKPLVFREGRVPGEGVLPCISYIYRYLSRNRVWFLRLSVLK